MKRIAEIGISTEAPSDRMIAREIDRVVDRIIDRTAPVVLPELLTSITVLRAPRPRLWSKKPSW